MFSACANPECLLPFDYQQGRFFRFHKSSVQDGEAPNTHSVQHFWLCQQCSQEFTLEYRNEAGVLLKNRPDLLHESEIERFVAAV